MCSQSGGGEPTTTQYHGKAYPGLRQLQVLKDLGSQAVITSICPKLTTGDATDPAYGYNPAMSALVAALGQSFSPKCLPRALTATEGRVPCAIIEVIPGGGSCACDAPGRRPVESDGTRAAIDNAMQTNGLCGGASTPACADFCVCELEQLESAGLASCQNDVSPDPSAVGWCYLDDALGLGNPELLASCPESQRRNLRFVGANTPAEGGLLFIACAGAPLGP